MNKLCLLDLDHTLIYGSYALSERVELLFEYSKYLKVYKRPYVEQFIEQLHKNYSSIIVFTTAKKDYAHRICTELKINVSNILSRSDCISKNERYYKPFKEKWVKAHHEIHIIDDSPNVWINTEDFEDIIKYITPKEFRGEPEDTVLINLM